jgi:hypothetical protein
MPQVFRTYVYQDGRYSRMDGESVVVDGATYVRQTYLDSLQSVTGWYATPEMADTAALAGLAAQRERIDATIAEIKRSLPAVVAADSSATGRAQAAVAT